MTTSGAVETRRITRLDRLMESLDRLLFQERGDGAHLSFYVNAGRLPDEGRQARIVFRNQLADARARLAEENRDELDRHLRDLEQLLDDDAFWSHQQGGLAVLVDESGPEILLTGTDLPSKWVYSSDFHLKPLMAAAANADAYWLLTLSQHEVRLHRGSRLGFREVECEGLPASYEEAMRVRGFDADSSAMKAAESQTKVDREHLRVFFKMVNEAVRKHLSGSELPLLVAGADYYEPIYRAVNSYPHLSERYWEGNVEDLHSQDLHRTALRLLRDDFKQSELRRLRRFKEVSETGAALDRLDLILAASEQGQVETLFVPSDQDCWGTFDPLETRIIDCEERPGLHNTDLYELAARTTLRTGGEVFFMDAVRLPVARKCIALLRWIGDPDESGLKHAGP